MAIDRSRAVATLLETRARALRRHLPPATAGDPRGIHQARVASRRLREALPVVTAGLDAPKTHKTIRKMRGLTQALGSVRELDVTLELLDELAASDDLSRPALDEVRLHVLSERERQRETMLGAVAKIDAAKLYRRLAGIADTLAADGANSWRQALARRLLKRARRLDHAMEAAGQLYVPEQLHQVRIAAKKLRYGLELAADAHVPRAAALVRAVKRTQETLGRLHDLQILQGHVVAVQAAPHARNGSHEALAGVAGRIEEQCRLLHGKYVGSVPALHDVTAAVRGEIVPRLTADVRPLKMGIRRRTADTRRAV